MCGRCHAHRRTLRGVVFEIFAEYMRDTRRTWVTGIGLANDICGQSTDGGDGSAVSALRCEARHGCRGERGGKVRLGIVSRGRDCYTAQIPPADDI